MIDLKSLARPNENHWSFDDRISLKQVIGLKISDDERIDAQIVELEDRYVRIRFGQGVSILGENDSFEIRKSDLTLTSKIGGEALVFLDEEDAVIGRFIECDPKSLTAVLILFDDFQVLSSHYIPAALTLIIDPEIQKVRKDGFLVRSADSSAVAVFSYYDRDGTLLWLGAQHRVACAQCKSDQVTIAALMADESTFTLRRIRASCIQCGHSWLEKRPQRSIGENFPGPL